MANFTTHCFQNNQIWQIFTEELCPDVDLLRKFMFDQNLLKSEADMDKNRPCALACIEGRHSNMKCLRAINLHFALKVLSSSS